jgi:hypothetical protein
MPAKGRQVGNNGKSRASANARDVTKGAEIVRRVAAGETVTAASRAVGVSQHHGSQLYLRELQRVTDDNADVRRFMLAQDLETLRQLIAAHMGPAVGQALFVTDSGEVIEDPKGRQRLDLREVMTQPPSYQSAKIVLSALDRRAKLLGLDAAIRVEVSNAKVANAVEDIEHMIDEADDTDLAEVLPIDGRRLG